MRRALIFLLTSALAWPQDTPTFRTETKLVVVTVYVRDKQGKPIPGLTKQDFIVTENGKPQTIGVFDYQNITGAKADVPAPTVTVAPTPGAAPPPTAPTGEIRFRDRRLLVLFFDWTSLAPAEQVRAKDAAVKFIKEQMTPADLISIASFGSKLTVNQEFTDDRDILLETVNKFQTGVMSELAGLSNTDVDTSDTAGFSTDDTEFNVFNTDRKLSALEDMARRLTALPEKKALIYFSGGVDRTGMENQSQLRATVNAAVRGNVSFYPIDVKGLTADPPGGGAATASPSGTGLFTGQTQGNQRTARYGQQDTLTSLAADTGGKALLEDNDLTTGIRRAQQDMQGYYVLGYYSSDDRRDGQFRNVDVKLAPSTQSRLSAKLDYRDGYYAEKDWKRFSSYDKEKQLEDALLLGDPVTELPLALEVNWFRFSRDRYFVPVAVKVPASVIPLAKKGTAETAQLDFIGQVTNAKGAVLVNLRDAIKIQLRDPADQIASRSLTYDTGFMLAPGPYKVKMLARENLSGRMGTFEMSFTIPDLGTVKDDVKLSSVVWSNQRVALTEAVGTANKDLVKKQDQHPLVLNKQKLLPSVTHAFRNGQTLSAYAEVYDPATGESGGQAQTAAIVGLYRGNELIAQSAPATSTVEGRRVRLLADLPLKNLNPGEYVAQLTVIDQAGKKFAFSRSPLVVIAGK